MAKKENPSFFEIRSYTGSLREGSAINIERSLMYRGEQADFKPFLDVPIKELEQRLKASKAEEKKVYDQLQKAAKAWDEHGAQTLLLQKAIEYLKVPAVTHTSNEWKKQKDGSWEISNMVYKMTFSIVKFGDEWKLEWEVSYMAPSLQIGYRGWERTPRERIDHEGSKKYKTLDGAQNYVQLKFDQYSSFFKELSPPVPPEAKELFCVNGQLLQGYTLGRPPAKKKEVTLSDLLACLEDGDTIQPKPPAVPTAPATVPSTERTQPAKVAVEPKKEPPQKSRSPSLRRSRFTRRRSRPRPDRGRLCHIRILTLGEKSKFPAISITERAIPR